MNKRENLTPYGDENVHLLYAYSGIDKDKLVSIEDTFEENSNLFCPLCGEAVFPRKGNHNRHSFAHKSGSCFPNSVMEDNFIINLALKKFYEVERIKTPARVYRLNKNGKNVLELKESPEVIRVKPDIKLDKIEGHQGLLGLALAKTYAGEPIAVLFLRKAEPYNSTIFQLMKEGYSVLSVNLENIQMPNSLDKILEFLIIENDKSKEWLSNLPYPDSLTYLERVLPKNALISKEENTQCKENSCSDCEFAVISIDNKELCLKNWTLNEWTRYHLEPTPDYIHKMDEYLEILEKLKNRISNTDSAWKSITNSLKILTPNLANKKSSDTLFEAGEIQESLNGEKGKFLIRWGFNSKTIVIFIEPIDNTDKDVPVYLFKIIKKVDYFNRRTLHDIRIFKSENKENLFNKIFYDLNTLLTDSPSWREINLRGNRALLKNYCFQLEQLLNKLQPIKVVKAERFLDEAYELLNRNSRFYKEDQNRILSPQNSALPILTNRKIKVVYLRLE